MRGVRAPFNSLDFLLALIYDAPTFDAKESRRRACQGNPFHDTIFLGRFSSGLGWSSPSAWPWARPFPPLPPSRPATATPSPPPRLRWRWWRRPRRNPNPFSPSSMALSPFPQSGSPLPIPGQRSPALSGMIPLRSFQPLPGCLRPSPALPPAHNPKTVGSFAISHKPGNPLAPSVVRVVYSGAPWACSVPCR